MKHKWSIYNNFIEVEDTGSTRIFNSINRATYELDKYTMECMEGFFNGEKVEDEELKDLIAKFCYEKLVVEEGFDEVKYFLDYRNRYYNSVFGSVIYFMPTMNCNFKCPYCIVANTDHNTGSSLAKIDNETIDASVRWIVNFLEKQKDKVQEALKENPDANKLRIVLFGGEPTLGHSENLKFLRGLKESIPKWSRLSVSIITNGYTLSDEMIEDYKVFEFTSVQITIDGPQRFHDVRRITTDDKGSYKRIIQNCHKVKDSGVTLVIRVNIDEGNVDHVSELLDDLKDEGFQEGTCLSLAPVDRCEGIMSEGGHAPHVLKKFAALYKYAGDLGFDFGHWETFCGVYASSFFALSPKGKLYKCPSMSEEVGCSVGSVFSDELDKGYYDVLGTSIDDKCASCSWVGVCGGGCYYQRYIDEKENIKKTSCNKLSFMELIGGYVLNRY